jgi:outer membrane lipoprotein-sorting protein
MRIKLKMMKMKIKKSHLKRRTMIKGEMLMIKTRKMMWVQDRHTQESTKRYNEITP